MAERYGLLPSELLALPIDEFVLNASVFLFASAERGLDRVWEKQQQDAKK